MKKLLIGLLALGSISSFAAKDTCVVEYLDCFGLTTGNKYKIMRSTDYIPNCGGFGNKIDLLEPQYEEFEIGSQRLLDRYGQAVAKVNHKEELILREWNVNRFPLFDGKVQLEGKGIQINASGDTTFNLGWKSKPIKLNVISPNSKTYTGDILYYKKSKIKGQKAEFVKTEENVSCLRKLE